ncbi:hypothetical protein [Chitinophaga nivalis]|uniref:T9SS C-terminal target domain-containing protein n=1 Tax=Chitinophaga nivalis TaxID=2991709 RepID=A0ABT3IIF5_9BACT|nr:hypothetical protein [Chitinophaga nivalis]MCW3466592.1 hypothetical protein [Chitinophaga nivalis]MCW3483717.1 hypothetical protein [Chitinophaga nivalis]
MTNFYRHTAAIMAMLIAGIFVASCKKDAQTQNERPVSATEIVPANGATLSGILGTGKTVRDTIHLTGGTYLLQGIVYVDTLDVVRIDAGTVIKGISSGDWRSPGGTLVITRGAKIEAVGTAAKPIIFTSNSATPASGQIGGVVILGRSTTNNYTDATIEGFGGIPVVDIRYGGNVETDNSGILKYVRIEYAGFEFSPDNELNGLTLGGVGSGTTIDFVEVYKAADDGIQFFGGTVDAKHLVIVNSLDDGLDFSNGYRGHIQYVLIIADSTRADKSASNGIEAQNTYTGDSRTPFTKPFIANLTLIGLPNHNLATKLNFLPSGTGKYGAATQWRRSSRFEVYNSIFIGYENGWLLDNTIPVGGTVVNTLESYRDGNSIFKHNLIHAYTRPFHSNPAYPFTTIKSYPSAADNNTGYTNVIDPNEAIKLADPFDRRIIGFYLPRIGPPPVASPALTGGLTTGLPAGLTGTKYRGAFDGLPANNWAAGWTVFTY